MTNGRILKDGPDHQIVGSRVVDGGLAALAAIGTPAASSWRPRVVRSSRGEDSFLVIVDVLHGVKGRTVLSSISAEASGENLDELRERLEQMLACLGEPIIEAKAPPNND